MTDVDDNEPLNVELVMPEPVVLMDDTCWVPDPDALHHESEAEGVIAVMFRGGAIWYLDGETRRWVNAETEQSGKKPVPFKTVQ